MAEIAPPNEAPGARLNDIVTAGNCPWWLIESASGTLSTRVNALRGTALGGAVAVAAFAVEAELLAPTLVFIAFVGTLRTAADGVYAAAVVVALEPAEDEPEAAK